MVRTGALELDWRTRGGGSGNDGTGRGSSVILAPGLDEGGAVYSSPPAPFNYSASRAKLPLGWRLMSDPDGLQNSVLTLDLAGFVPSLIAQVHVWGELELP